MSPPTLIFSFFISTAAWASLTPGLFPRQVAQGEVALLRTPVTAKATFRSTELPLHDCSTAKQKARCGFIAIPADTAPGRQEILVWWEEGGQEQRRSVHLDVRRNTFPVSKLRVAPKTLRPSEADEKRLIEEREAVRAAYAKPLPLRQWDQGFQLPVRGPITCRFGAKRTFNGEIKNIHSGVDLRAGTGTRIHSASAGMVVLARSLFFAGNMIIIDHGLGVFTNYAHLSAIKVKVGQPVKKGELIGLAGATGRVTGPHLHWGMRVNGISVDPHQAKNLLNGRELALTPLL